MSLTILVIGAGRSSSSLVSFLIQKREELNIQITIGDLSLKAAEEKAGTKAKAIHFDIANKEESAKSIEAHHIIVSLIPASLHVQVAELCLRFKKHLFTASYVSEKMQSFDSQAKENGLLFLNECGLDPGLDHMTAMEIIDTIKQQGGEIESFESFTGGLIAPGTDPENPWKYKFTWNPRNVVLAGQGTAKYLKNGKSKYIPYQRLFKNTTAITIPGIGEFEGYANRDSLGYLETYGLKTVKTMVRGTLRNKGYCTAWDTFVQLGCTDDSFELTDIARLTHIQFLELFLEDDKNQTIQGKLANTLNIAINGYEMRCLQWLDFFSAIEVGLTKGTPAQVLEHILNKKWKLNAEDKDQIVMWHRFTYKLENRLYEIQASLESVGDDSAHTAMAKTVGLPLAVAVELLVKNKIIERGVLIPTSQKLYTPILSELKKLGITLNHRTEEITHLTKR